MDQFLSQLPQALLNWYQLNKRELPWRKDSEPYHVWLSEIMLQQTRVEAVKGYYTRFLQALPTIADLANAEESLLLKLWEGLGYYSRVRNLQKAAQLIIQEYHGQFPAHYDQVLSLPGIGEYTAGAICSIAFGQPTPAVDGNVLRVYARLTADNTPIDLPEMKKKVRGALASVYPAQAGDFTQALMELGATICGPNRVPDCKNCPCRNFCQGASLGMAEKLPVKLPKRGRRIEAKTVFLFHCDGCYALHRRPSKGLLAGLWQFPEAPGMLNPTQAIQMARAMGIAVKDIHRQVDKTHIFTHIQWNMRGYYLEAAEKSGNFTWLTAAQIRDDAALPTAYRQFWEDKL